VVLETCGGYGRLFTWCYRDVAAGLVLEKDPRKTAVLAQQRPTWGVYECDCIGALAAGIANEWPINYVDLDPWGQPWEILDALLVGQRSWPKLWGLVVTDGLRQKLQYAGGWDVKSLAGLIEQYGNGCLYEHYVGLCRELVAQKAGAIGYTIGKWAGYHCGYNAEMTHYAALLTRTRSYAGAPVAAA